MSTHTPGPWLLSGHDPKHDQWRIAQKDVLGQPVAVTKSKANARLIAAAPDMLKELKWIAGRIDRNSGSPNFTSDEHDRIVAAIAKAEGTQS